PPPTPVKAHPRPMLGRGNRLSHSRARRRGTSPRSLPNPQPSSLTWRLRSLAAAEPHEGLTLGLCLAAANEAPIDQHGAEGPDALQVLIGEVFLDAGSAPFEFKAPMVLPDLEGCGRPQPRNPPKA